MRLAFRITSIITPNKRRYHFIRRTSDQICKEVGLSVIVPSRDKGRSCIEHQAEQSGTCYKAKLRAVIDQLLPGCSDPEELLRCLQREGYAWIDGRPRLSASHGSVPGRPACSLTFRTISKPSREQATNTGRHREFEASH